MQRLPVRQFNLVIIFFLVILPVSLSPLSVMLVRGDSQKTVTPQWVQTYGPYLGFSIIQTSDGGFAIAGQDASYKPFAPHNPSEWENYTALLIKIDATGNLTWKKTYESQVGFGLFSNRANSIVETKDSGYAICGHDWLLKVDSQGNVQWSRTFSNLEICRAIQSNDGKFVIIGNTNDNSHNVRSELLKIDSSGEIMWTMNFGSDKSASGYVAIDSVEQTSDGGFTVAGSWNSLFWFAKTDFNGNIVINQTYGSIVDFSGTFTSVMETSDSGYILGGYNYNPTKDVAWVAIVVKTDSQGNAQWNFPFEQPASDLLRGAEFRSIIQTVDGGYIAAGYPALVKLDSNGKQEWNMTGYNAYSIVPDSGGGFVVAGGQGSVSGPDQQIWVAKFVESSTVPSETAMPSQTNPAGGAAFPTTLVIMVPVILAVAVVVGLLVYLKKHQH